MDGGSSLPAMQKRLSEVVAEYDDKHAAIGDVLTAFKSAGETLKTAATLGGTWGRVSLDVGRVYESNIADSLLKSAWLHVYQGLNIDRIASAKDKRKFEQAITSPAPFTLDNIRATFGDFVADPRGNILRGLAEAFCDLDPAYKSHDKVHIGVKGLPKRVILSSVGSSGAWGTERLINVLNALAAYQGKPLVEWREVNALLRDGEIMRDGGFLPQDLGYRHGIKQDGKPEEIIARGVWLKRFANGNGHLFFTTETLRDINRALAEYYGEVLADCSDDSAAKPRPGTAVSKDLQYYPTPPDVVRRVMAELYHVKGKRVLEPSCGCGRFLDALRDAGADVMGVEVDPARARLCDAKGHRVLRTNFLETVPTPSFDQVVMNPPFYGRHYVKHVKHAMKFLKPGGHLTAILPATARYDHGELSGRWEDLPVGAFSESGTNINTTILTMRA
jgi:hypothetical protein